MESLVRLFFVQGQISDLEQAYNSDPQGTARLIFYWRDRNRGLGLRKLFQLAFIWIAERDPTFLGLLPQIPVYGCWKDLVVIAGKLPIALEPIAQLFASQLLCDQKAMRQGKYITTAAKWFPSAHAANGRSSLTQRVQAILNVTEEGMRRTFLSPLRFYLQTAERQLSTAQSPNYRRVTKGANKRYAQTFRRINNTWTATESRPQSLLEVVANILAGRPLEAEKHWKRYVGGATAIDVAVVCDSSTSDIVYPITLALAVGKDNIYRYANPVVRVKFPAESSLALKVAILQNESNEAQISLAGVSTPCVVVVTSKPFPQPLPLLAEGQRLVWWRSGPTVTVTEHSPRHVEICGFNAKLFSVLAKGHVPSLTHIVASTLEKYHKITTSGSEISLSDALCRRIELQPSVDH